MLVGECSRGISPPDLDSELCDLRPVLGFDLEAFPPRVGNRNARSKQGQCQCQCDKIP